MCGAGLDQSSSRKNMRYLSLLPFACFMLAANVHADTTETCHASSEKEIAGLFDRWNASLQTGAPSKVAANYAKKSILLPTLSNKPRLTVEEKEDYFEHFLAAKPFGTIDSRTIEIDCNSAVDAGLYTFKFADGRQVKARYTFTYKWDDQQWLITSHHSSAMPEKN
jgi:uncharacterized protein (TIGR02246 family)